MRRTSIFIMVIALAFAFAAPAAADTIHFNGWQQRGLSIKGKLDHKNMSVPGVGEFDISWNEGEVLSAFCVTLLKYGVGGTYDVTSLDLLDPDEYQALYQSAWIMDNYAPGLGFESDYYSDKVAATAVQSALWTLTTPYDSQPFTLTKVTSGSKQEKDRTMELYAQVLSEAEGVDFSTYTFKHTFSFGDSRGSTQDLLFAGPGAAGTPEPGTMLLLGSALGAFAWRRRRKRR